LDKWQTHLLTHSQQAATQDSTSARRPGITTTGCNTGKKLPHDVAKQLQSAAPGLLITP